MNRCMRMLTFGVVAAGLSLVAHANDEPSFGTTGTWGTSSLAAHEPDKVSLWTYEAGATATWRPAFDQAVRARVWMHKIVHTARNDPAARVTIRAAGQPEAVRLDFSEGPTGWQELGVYDFAGEDADEYVRISRPEDMETDQITTRASAVRFEVLEPAEEGSPRVVRSITIDELTDAEGRALRGQPRPSACGRRLGGGHAGRLHVKAHRRRIKRFYG